MQITETQLRRTVKQLLKEEVYGTIATVYHGSRQRPAKFIKVFEDESGLVGWETGKGAGSAYGHGLYTVWKKTDHQTFRGGYGNWIYKFKVNLHGFIIFDETVCRQVYGSSLTPLEQLEKIGKTDVMNNFSEKAKQLLSKPPVKNNRSAHLAAGVAKFLAGHINGIVFWGDTDGPVVIAYDPNIVTPMAYATLEDAKNDHWTPWKADEIKHSRARSAHAGTFADPGRLQNIKHFDLNKFFKNHSKLDDNKILEILQSIDKIRLSNIARDKSTPLKILMNLARDSDPNVRSIVAQNESTPLETLMKLANDDSETVRVNVAYYKKTPPEVLMKLADDSEIKIRSAVAYNSSTPPEILMKLARDKHANIRLDVIYNPSTPLEALRKLTNDKSKKVKVAAQQALQARGLQESKLRHLIHQLLR